jgi:uncharacterized protein (DUF1330 family)
VRCIVDPTRGRSPLADSHHIVIENILMPAYFIVNIDVTDPVGFETYRSLAAPTIAAAGGRYRIRGGNVQVLEGQWQPKRLVMLEFDSVAAALEWYESDEYAPVKAIRERTARSEVVIVEGLTPG